MPEGIVALEPIMVRIRKAPLVTGESVVTLYDAVRKGKLDLYHDEAGHSFLLYEQLKARCAARKRVTTISEKPHLAAARNAYHARRKQTRKRKT